MAELIFIVEDEPGIAEVVSLYMRRAGFRASIAADGREVLSGVAEIVGVEPAQIEDDVTRFLADLVSRGLLTREERG